MADREGVIAHWGASARRPSATLGGGARQDGALIIPPVLQERHWQGFNKAVSTGQLKRPGKTLKVPAIHKSGAVLAMEGKLTLDRGDDGSVDTVTLRSWRGTRMDAARLASVLAVLRAAQAVGERIRPASRS